MRPQQHDGRHSDTVTDTVADPSGGEIPPQRGSSEPGHLGASGDADWDTQVNGQQVWAQRSRIVLTPVAAPSILGLFGFAGATFMVASLLAGWWGSPTADAPVIAPFALFFGGLAQLLAGMWSYRARDSIATAMHGTWGSFWLAWAVLVGLVNIGALPATTLTSPALGFWFIVLTIVTGFGTLAAATRNAALTLVLALLTVGSGLLAAGFVGTLPVLVVIAGWVLVASAVAAFYTAGAMMLAEASGGRTILPLGTYESAANIPGRQATQPIGYPHGMPGSKVGQ
jgi:hypothetical protein